VKNPLKDATDLYWRTGDKDAFALMKKTDDELRSKPNYKLPRDWNRLPITLTDGTILSRDTVLQIRSKQDQCMFMANYSDLHSRERKERKDQREVWRREKGRYDPETLHLHDKRRRRAEKERLHRGLDSDSESEPSSSESDFDESKTYYDNWSHNKSYKGKMKRKVAELKKYDSKEFD
jgi:hypothetical protein